MRNHYRTSKPSACVRVCVFTCPPPLRQPSLRSPPSLPSPASDLLQPRSLPALPLSPPSLLKTREAPEDFLGQVVKHRVIQVKEPNARQAAEDRLGQVAQLIAAQRELPAGTHVVENTIFQCLDTLVAEVQISRLAGAGACAVQDAAGVCEKNAVAECTRHYFMKRLGRRLFPRHARVRGPDYIRITFGTMRSEEQGEKRQNDDDVFYLFLQKQNLGAKLHIYL